MLLRYQMYIIIGGDFCSHHNSILIYFFKSNSYVKLHIKLGAISFL